MLSQSLSVARSAAVIETAAPTPSGSECAAVACHGGSPSSPSPVPPVALGLLAAGALLVLVAQIVRRARASSEPLPDGNPIRLLRPPQLIFSL
jgi:hypothetical protein